MKALLCEKKPFWSIPYTMQKKTPKNNQHENRYGPVSLGRHWGIFAYFIIRFYQTAITLRFLLYKYCWDLFWNFCWLKKGNVGGIFLFIRWKKKFRKEKFSWKTKMAFFANFKFCRDRITSDSIFGNVNELSISALQTHSL